MTKHIRYPHIAMSVLAAGFLLTGCSGKDQGPSEPAKAASAAAVAPVSSETSSAPLQTMTPIPYVPEQAASAITTCNIEGFDKVSFQSEPSEAALSATHNISGWVAAPQLTAPSFWLRLDDKTQGRYFQVRVTPSIKRPDVAASASNPPLPESSGFVQELPVNAVPAGSYHLYLVAREGDKFSICDDGRQVDFK